jgi:hypothetical protein
MQLRPSKRWPEAERLAEAFAAWFLMPRRAVRAGLRRLGLVQPRTPEDVYRLALLLGTSYRGTARQMLNLKLATRRDVTEWAAVPPGRIKDRMDAKPRRMSSGNDVWLVDQRFNGHTIHVAAGDRIELRLPTSAGEWGIKVPTGLVLLDCKTELHMQRFQLEVTEGVSDLSVVSAHHNGQKDWRMTVSRIAPRLGVDTAWS